MVIALVRRWSPTRGSWSAAMMRLAPDEHPDLGADVIVRGEGDIATEFVRAIDKKHLGPSRGSRFDPGVVRKRKPFEINRLAEDVFRAIEPLNRRRFRRLRELEHLVDQTGASWNRIVTWLRRLDGFRIGGMSA